MISNNDKISTNLAITFKDVALEDVSGAISCDIREDLQVRAVVGDVEDAVDGMVHDLRSVRGDTRL